MQDETRLTFLSERLRALNQLIAGVAHEINNPLTSIQGLASLLRNEAAHPQALEDLDVIIQEARRAVGIVKNLRAFAGTSRDDTQPCSLNDAVRLVVDVRGYETRARGIQVAVDLHPDLPAGSVTRRALLHLVLLLLLAAEEAFAERRAHSGAPGESDRILLRTETDPAGLALTLTLTGAGLPAAAGPLMTAARVAAGDLGGSLVGEVPSGDQAALRVTLPASG
ncbi:MAG: hypothetical protein M1325_02995 [Actinobacteria bacterium]|nr:hypothetical protein [Actinomycetota bacterium]